MSRYCYDKNEIIQKEDSIDDYKNLFSEYYKNCPTLNEALEQMFTSSGINVLQSMNLIAEVMVNVERIININFNRITIKYPDITKEDAEIISSITCEFFLMGYSPYKILNINLMKDDRLSGIKNISKYLFLLLSSLRKLKKYTPNGAQKVLYLCIKTNVKLEDTTNPNNSFKKGNKIIFWGFTSVTDDLGKAEELLMTERGKKEGTILILKGDVWGYDISLFNCCRQNLIILEPETKYIIEDIIPPNNDNGITYINCKIESSMNSILKDVYFQKHNYQVISSIIWADPDKSIESSSIYFNQEGYQLHFFHDTPSCIKFFKENKYQKININCIITSEFDNNNRYNHPNGFQMIEQIKKLLKNNLNPLYVLMASNPDEQNSKYFGFDLIVNNDREKMQKIVIDKIKNLQKNITLAKEFYVNLDKNYITNKIWDKDFDKCFCQNCELKSMSYSGMLNLKYSLPIGWYRFGIKIKDEYIKKNFNISDWNIVYYGTNLNAAISIINNQRIMFPGEILNNGEIFPPQNDINPKAIYLSPSIKYAKLFSNDTSYNGKPIYIAFECRIKPGSYSINRIPDNFEGDNIDNNYFEDEIEWVVYKNPYIVPIGLLISF